MTADGRRFRTGGGILWNILKTREPKAYKEIMAKAREFEKDLRRPKCNINNKRHEMVKSKENEDTKEEEEIELLDANEPLNNCDDDANQKEKEEENHSGDKNERKSVRERIRVPVSYDDLFEEGEIQE
ncbi:hypothetical protein LUZ60_014291 [Juncus effusus]|nr:hypothetical protein LUZ60_014291 [Juncus effusus]